MTSTSKVCCKYEINVEKRMLDTILYAVDKSDTPRYLLQGIISVFL
jgi:hypothetical protein